MFTFTMIGSIMMIVGMLLLVFLFFKRGKRESLSDINRDRYKR